MDDPEGSRLGNVNLAGAKNTVFTQVVNYAGVNGWLGELVTSSLRSAPNSEPLRRVAQTLGVPVPLAIQDTTQALPELRSSRCIAARPGVPGSIPGTPAGLGPDQPGPADENHQILLRVRETSPGCFIADERVAIAALTLALVVEAALSAFHGQEGRNAFLARFDLSAGLGDDLPFGANLGIVAVAPATALIGLVPVIMEWLGVPRPAGMPPMTFGKALASSFVFTGQQVLAVLWAVLPKALTRVARQRP